MDASAAREDCLASLHGMGGHLMLFGDRITMVRHGPWFTAVNLLDRKSVV